MAAMQRPVIFEYKDIPQFIADMIAFRKKTEGGFSVLNVTKKLRRCSPALVTQVIKGKRTLTPDRVADFAKIAGLTPQEQSYLSQWVLSLAAPHEEQKDTKVPAKPMPRKRTTSNHLLQDWVNVYVKDAFRLEEVQRDNQEIYRLLGGIATKARIDKAIRFLLKEGFLRRTLEGKLVESEPLHTTTNDLPNQKIRQFHKQALTIAKNAIEIYPTQQRYANALLLPLNKKSYEELKLLIQEFAEKLQVFAEEHAEDNQALYQIIIHASPTGGGFEKD